MAMAGGVGSGGLHLPSYEWLFPSFRGIYCGDGMRHGTFCKAMMLCFSFKVGGV